MPAAKGVKAEVEKAEAETEAEPAEELQVITFPDELIGWTPFRDSVVIWAQHATQPFKYEDTEYSGANWLVRNEAGEDSIVSDEEFSQKYIAISPAKWDEEIPREPPRRP